MSHLPTKKGSEFAHIEYAISPQAHTPMYLMHKYWARKPHNVVGEYIEHYSKKGEIVLDPFVGSGVTAIEALKHGRKAIAIDLNPISTFITKMTLIPIELEKITEAYNQIRQKVKTEINQLYETRCPKCGQKALTVCAIWELGKDIPNEIRLYCKKEDMKVTKQPDEDDTKKILEIRNMDIPFWYPKDKLQYSDGQDFEEGTHIAGLNSIKSLFTKRNLIALSILHHQIENFEGDDTIRDLLKFRFTSITHLASRMTPVRPTRPYSSFWAMHRYATLPISMESNVWLLFQSSIKGRQGLISGKEDSNNSIKVFKEAQSFDDLRHDSNILISNKSALNLENPPSKIPPESVDYVFTDPPYGGSIQYGELSALWLSWLKGEKNDPQFQFKFDEEVTINASQKKDFDYYHKMLKASFEQVYDVLKSGKWVTVTFHNTDIKTYNSIIKAVVLAGFDLEKVVYQPPARTSAKGLLNPYGSAVGDYYIRFRKPITKEKLLTESEVDKERYERIVVDTVKRIIAERREPVTYSIIINSYPTIFEHLKKNGYTFSAPEGLEEVLKKHLNKEFVLVDVTNEKGKVIGKKWWLKEKLFLDRASLGERIEATIIAVLNRRVVVSFDEILEELFTTFQNSLTPDTQSVKNILEEYAEKTADGKWQLKKEVKVRLSQHNLIIKMLTEVGKKIGFEVYAAHLPEYRGMSFDLPLSKDKIDRIREIDVLWLKNSEIAYEFEVENSTGISDAFIRGSNIPSKDIKRYIVIPEERRNLLSMKIAEPILKENIDVYNWKFIFYNAFLAFYEQSGQKKIIDPDEINKLANLTTRAHPEQQTMSQFMKPD